ncbi:MAG: PQQ-binding-like beta-propeller repeat protein [Bacteroidota bacterium]|nr:PQQ-binding-like beta-propeller repeat protein [Bacteroidota bacterium]
MKIKSIMLFLLLCTINMFAIGQINIEGNKTAFLFTEHINNRVGICDENGKIVWEINCAHPQDAWVLPNGKQVLTSSKDDAMIIRIKDKKVLWHYKIESPYENPYVQPLRNGHVVIGIEGRNAFLEFNKRGKLIHETKVAINARQVHGTFRFVRRTKEDTYVIPVTAENQFREVNLSGEVIRVFNYKGKDAISALRLANGNTILGVGSTGEIVEVDKNDQVVWRISNKDLPDLSINFIAGMHLAGDILYVTNYGLQGNSSRELPHYFAINRKTKQVVWRAWSNCIGNAAQIQGLDHKFRPLKGEL